jgi:hypothetical protein
VRIPGAAAGTEWWCWGKLFPCCYVVRAVGDADACECMAVGDVNVEVQKCKSARLRCCH